MQESKRYAPAPLSDVLRVLAVWFAALPALQPLLEPGLIGPTHDGIGHLYRLLEFDLSFRSGNLYPRLAPNLLLDYGYATFTYYPPLSVIISEAGYLFGLGYIDSLKAGFAFGIVASGLGMYLLVREIFGRDAGTLAAIVYIYLPYRLLDVYTRGDLAESLGLAALPFTFWGFLRLVRSARFSDAIAAGVSLAALILAHNITALFAMPVLAGFVLTATRGRLGRREIGLGILAGTVAAVLTAVYWLPVTTQLGDLNTIALTAGYFDYHNHFIPPNQLIQGRWDYDYRWQPEVGASFTVGRMQFVVGLVALGWTLLAHPSRRRIVIYSGVVIVVLLWLQQAGSTFLWDRIPFARFIQFPFRLGSYIGLLSALIIGAVASSPTPRGLFGLPRERPRPFQLAAALAGLTLTGAFVAASLINLPREHDPVTDAEINLPTIWRIESSHELVAGTTGLDYLPTWAGDPFLFFKTAKHGASPTPESQSTARITASYFTANDFVGTVTADAPALVRLDRVYYRGWQATVDDQPALVQPDGPLGLAAVSVPPGPHHLIIRYSGTPVEQASIFVTLLGALTLICLIVRPGRSGWSVRAVIAVVLVSSASLAISHQIQPPRMLAGGADFEQSVRLVGSEIEQEPGSQEGVVDVSLLWQPLQAALPHCTVHLRLLDQAGLVVATRDKPPLFGLRDCSTWQVGDLVRDHEQIRLPVGTAATTYRLSLGLSLGDQVDSITGAPAAIDSWFPLGDVSAPSRPPAKLRIDQPAGAINVGNAFRLIATQVLALGPPGMVSPEPVGSPFVAHIHPGDRLQVALVWRSTADVATDYRVFTQLLDGDHQRVAADESWPKNSRYPTSVRFPGDDVSELYELQTSPTLATGVYTLVTGMFDQQTLKRLSVSQGRGTQDQVVLGMVKVSRDDQIFGQITPLGGITGTLGGQVTLVGASVTHTPNDRLAMVRLGWRAVARPTSNYTVFVHVLDATGKVIAQHDGPPRRGTYPTSFWEPGDVVFDSVEINLPEHLPPGDYPVEVGLYELETGTRLVDPSGAGAYTIGSVNER